jgi:hypothetical protein
MLINVVDDDEDEDEENDLNDGNINTGVGEMQYESETSDEDDGAKKCSSCSKVYKNAMISVNCWHVNCKKCWTKSLEQSSSPTCPQCNSYTTIKDLKRIIL